MFGESGVILLRNDQYCSSLSGVQVATHSGCIMDWAAQVKEGSIRQLLCRQHCAIPYEARPADKWQSQGPHTKRSRINVLKDSPKYFKSCLSYVFLIDGKWCLTQGRTLPC